MFDNKKLEVNKEELLEYYKENGPAVLGKFVVVDTSHSLPFLKERTLESGVVVPAPKTYDDEHNKSSVPFDGIVVGVGPDCTIIEPGDHICLPLNNNSMWMINWKGNLPTRKYVVMLEESIRARFD